MKKTFHITTFGCQMNKLDSELIQAALQRHDYVPVADQEDAGVVLYNTCSVRDQAENRVLSHLGTFRERAEEDPDFILGVTGCMAQRMGEQLTHKFPFVNLVCGTRRFLQIPDYLNHIRETGESIVALDQDPLESQPAPESRLVGHQAYVSIMRGCNNFCAYCIVPHVRGREKSRPMGEIKTEVQRLVEEGAVEVNLLGQNVNSYGNDRDDDASLDRLLHEVNEVDGLGRIRFITSHPRDMNEAILRAVADLDKVCEHVHMAAQSGSDAVLERMNRHYTREHYLDVVAIGRELVPDMAFASDFIVGFPGETDEDFQKTLELVHDVGFQQSYIFRYSPRPDTRAAEMEDDVPDQVKRDRQQQLLSAQKEVDAERRQSLVGTTREVLCEEENETHPEEGKWRGRTRENDIVVFSSPTAQPGDILPVHITKSTALTLFGEAEDSRDES